MSIKAIETRYRGYRFRSRTEARWALFFDLVGIKWEYETERFALPDGKRYLPDFFIHMQPSYDRYPTMGYWVEVKGVKPTEEEFALLQSLCQETKHHGLILYGAPGENPPISIGMSEPAQNGASNAAWEWVERTAAKLTEDWDGIDWLYASRLSCCWREDVEDDFQMICDAIAAVRYERFEHPGLSAVA